MTAVPPVARERTPIADFVEQLLHRPGQAPAPASVPPMSALPPTAAEAIEIRAAQEAATTREDHTVTFASPIRHDLETVLTVLGGIAPRIIAVAEDQRVDELVEVALGAAGLGVADEVFAAATDALRAASARKAPAQPQAAPQVTA